MGHIATVVLLFFKIKLLEFETDMDLFKME